jgi:hypothetical protein
MQSALKRASLEALLRDKRLDRTLLPAVADPPADTVVPAGLPAIDAALRGGFPKGQLSEIVGARSAGRATVVHALLAGVTAGGDLAALVDSLDTFDPASAALAGVDLTRLLWVRGAPLGAWSGGGSLMQTACERAIKAFNLILQAGGYAAVVLDLADVPPAIIGRIPFITWLRLQRGIEGRDTVGLLVADTRAGRSARGVSLLLEPAPPLPLQRSPWQPPPFVLAPRCQRPAAAR